MAKKAAGDSAARLFRPDLLESRAIAIPAALAGEERARFVQRIAAGVRQQSVLAGKSDAILRIEADVLEEGGHLIVRQEPAACIDINDLLKNRPQPDLSTLWWLSWATIRALKAAAGDGAIHGGIQPGTVYLDALGRVKLGDFGIAAAIETVCGIEKRTQIHLDSAPQPIGARSVSGVWALLDEAETRDQGWIAPFFGHELLEGRQRLNAKSDQFALGTVLYLLATGSHPYGADFADPGLNFYMFVEPAALADERKDWADAFERRDKGLAGPSDNPLFAWQALVTRLLHSDPGERFANAAEAEKACADFIDAAWPQAAEALQKADAALREGNPEGFLAAVADWRGDERLPALWRGALGPLVDRVNSEKERIVKSRKLDQQLKEAEAAIEAGALGKATEIARGVIDSELARDAQRDAARELIRIVEEQQQILESGADELAREYLEAARKQFAAGSSGEARQTIDAVLADPATPTARQVQARHLLAEIDLAEQRRERQAAELSLAEAERKAGQYGAAIQRLESLLATEGLAAEVGGQARLLLEDVRESERRRDEFARALEEARNAWETADLATLEARLQAIPENFDDEAIAEGRGDLRARAGKLKAALAAQAEAEAAIQKGRDEAALTALDRALHEPELPQRLLDTLHAHRDECHKRVEQARRALIDQALAALTAAQAAFEAGDFGAAKSATEKSVLTEVALPAAKRRDAEALLEACQRVERAREVIEACRGHIADKDADSVERLLASLKVDQLPRSVLAEVDALRADAQTLREQFAAVERSRLARSLDDVESRISRGQFEDVEANLKTLGESANLDDAIRSRLTRVRKELDRLRPLIKALATAEKAIKEPATDFGPALKALDSLKEGAPDWLVKRRDAARAKIEQALEARRAEALATAKTLLDAAHAAVDQGDAAAARARLDEFRGLSVADVKLAQRAESLAAAAKALEAFQPKLDSIRAKLAAGDLAAALEAAAAIAKDAKAPPPLVKAAESLAGEAKKRIAARRTELEGELNALAGRIAQKGKRDRGIADALAALRADPLATDALHQKADELTAQYAALPEPKSPLPMILAIVAVLAVLGGAGYWFTRPRPPPTPAELIAAAQSRLSSELQALTQRASGENRETPAWTIEFRPPNGFPTTAVLSASGKNVALGDAAGADALPALALAPRYEELFKKKPEIPASERIAAALSRLGGELAKMKAAAGQQNREIFDWTLAADPADKLPTRVVAKRAGAPELALGEISNPAALDSFSIAERLGELFPEKKPVMPKDREVIAAGLEKLNKEMTALAKTAAASPDREKRTWTLAFDRPEPFPVALSATRAGETLKLETFENAAALAGFKLADRIDALFPKMALPSDAEVITKGLDALKATLAELLRKATSEKREAPAWAIIAATPAKLPTKIEARAGDRTIALGEVAKAADFAAIDLSKRYDDLYPLPSTTMVKAIRLDPAYDARLRFTPATENAVTSSASGVTMTGTAKLSADTSTSSFAFKGAFDAGTLSADAATKTAFATYLAGFQTAAAGKVTISGLAGDWKIRPKVDFKGGAAATIEITDAAGGLLASAPAPWQPDTLEYALADADARTARTAALRAAVAKADVKKALLEAFAAEVTGLKPAAGAVGATYFGSVKPVNFTVNPPDAAAPESVSATVALGPATGSRPDDQVSVDAEIVIADGKLAWHVDKPTAAAAVAKRLADMSRSEAIQKARRDAVFAEVSTTAGNAKATLEKSGDSWVIRVADGEKAGDYALTWNADAFKYDSVFTAKPKTTDIAAQLAQRLATDAKNATLDLNELSGLLNAVAVVKIRDVFGGGGADVRPIANLESGAGLAAATAALRSLMDDPAGAESRIPNIFVEYIQTPAGIYGVGWQSDAAGKPTAPRVWLAVDAAALPQLGSPAAVRSFFAVEANGEKLLGPAFGTQVAGTNGSLGLMVAPDGPLWYVRWEAVHFRQRAVVGVSNLHANPTPPNCTNLRELLDATRQAAGGFAYRRVGIWPLPSLACEWTGPTPRTTIRLGDTTKALRFNDVLGDRATMVGRILDPDTSVRDAWTSDKNNLVRDNLGYRFWDAGYSGAIWTPQRTIAFVVVLHGQ